MTMFEIRYTGTVIVPDGSDTNSYGEPCEPGMGYETVDGWIDPAWSMFTPDSERPAKPHDIIDLTDKWDRVELWERYAGSVDDMIRDRIGDVLGFIDHETGDGTYYGGTEHTDYGSGETVTLAAHIEIGGSRLGQFWYRFLGKLGI